MTRRIAPIALIAAALIMAAAPLALSAPVEQIVFYVH